MATCYTKNRALESMARFKVGDRVELTGDIAQFYPCRIGIIVAADTRLSAVLHQYQVRLADKKENIFFDFQLTSLPAAVARIMFDSSVSAKNHGVRGKAPGRHLRAISGTIDIHLRVDASKATIVGQVMAGVSKQHPALVSLLVENEPVKTTSTDDLGEFSFRHVPAGDVMVEVAMPSKRILVPLTI